ncbi:MAG TPA: hypothetical protein VD997_07245 [Phycisphaerales bacterium]|nr:hypothetical protein [Phycisphaerales bacterium]
MVQRVLGVAGLCGLVAGGLAGRAWAQDSARPTGDVQTTTATETTTSTDKTLNAQAGFERDPSKWDVSIEPAGWFVGASGRVVLPRETTTGAPAKQRLVDLNMDNPRFEPLLEVNARRGDWRATFRGSYFGAERDTTGLTGELGDVSFDSSDTIRTGLDLAILELEGAYTFAGRPQERQPDGTFAFDPRLDVVFGAHIYAEEWTIENLSGGTGVTSQKQSDWFVQPLIGLKLAADLYEEVTLDAQMTFGGLPTGDDSYSLDIIVGAQWRPWTNIGVQLGYRAVFFGLGGGEGDGEFSFDGSLQGLYAGVVVRF